MITIIQATAILSVLMAFGVDTSTIDKVRAILIPTQTVVNYVPVIQAPVVQNQPVYFGSTNTQPVNNQEQVQSSVVQFTPMKDITVRVTESTRPDDSRYVYLYVYYKEDGKVVKDTPITLTVDEGVIRTNGKEFGTTATSVASYRVGTVGDYGVEFSFEPVTTSGKKEVTITVGDLSKKVVVF